LRNSFGAGLLADGMPDDKARQLLGLREDSSMKRYKRVAKRTAAQEPRPDGQATGEGGEKENF
jgi:hypothetical protein